MIYNTTHKFTKMMTARSQEEIYNCPEYFAMSRDEIVNSGCPAFLKDTLDEFPWNDRPNVIQVRPQDFRLGKPSLLGDHWHVDVNVRLKDGTVRAAQDMLDFRLLVVSFGNIVETEFIKTPMDLPDLCTAGISHPEVFGRVSTMSMEIEAPLPNQMGEYTSLDIHRMGKNHKVGRLRLMIVAFESSTVPSGGWALPSIREKDGGNNGPKFEDYII